MTTISLLLSHTLQRQTHIKVSNIHQRSILSKEMIQPRRFSTSPPSSNRVARTLYRQLLRWCQATNPTIPLGSFVPPIHIAAPEQIDAYRMELLAQGATDMDDTSITRARSLLPTQTELKPKHMTVPIHNSNDLKGFFRAIYRLNSEETLPEYQKQRVSVAFEALKSLNECNRGLEFLQQQREKHLDRENVQFRVGQVVQHQHDRWRGVIATWERPDESSSSQEQLTSLTTKDYTDDIQHIRYDVILDSGDAHSMSSSTGWSTAVQSDLVPVTDKDLIRIRSNAIDQHFTRFDDSTLSFVPNELCAFEYPMDLVETNDKLSPKSMQLCEDIITGVQDMASRLERCILDETSCPAERGFKLLSNVQMRLRDLTTGDILSTSFRFAKDGVRPTTFAAMHLRHLTMLQLEVLDVNFQRKLAKEHKDKIRFNIGDVVQHKMYGFRGIVVAWDPKPTVDVSRWDGLQHIENPMEQPFYHVIPDQGDCIEAFGGERPLRYVCEENLEECPSNRRLIDVDLEPEWERQPSDGSYTAPADIRFKYGEDLDDDGVTEHCMYRIQDEFNSWHLLARESSNDSLTLSLKNMLELLQLVDNINDAGSVQDTIKEMRNAHCRREFRWRHYNGVAELMSGNALRALQIFQSLVKDDPNYVEAWNKIATCEFMLGRLDDSLESTNKVLELDPTHFQALNGLGLIYFEKGEYKEAVNAFRKSISLDPWSPVSAKLSASLDLQTHLVEKNELPS